MRHGEIHIGVNSGPGLERNGSDDNLVVQCCKCCSNEGSDPEDPLKAERYNISSSSDLQ